MINLFQIIITGIPVSETDAKNIRQFCLENNIFAIDWCHPNGQIGYIDASKKNINESILKEDLVKITNAFPFLQLGITLMSGSPGKYNFPIVQYSVNGKKILKQISSPHFGHPAPKRFKQTT